jgi:hypothetical protein
LDQAGAPFPGVTLAVMDGANVGRQGATDGQGRYSLTALQPGSLTLQVAASGYVKVKQPLTITTSSMANFQLALVPPEFTTTVDKLTVVSNPDGTSSAFGEVKNIGEGCATNLSAMGDILNDQGESIQSISWSMPPDQVLKPGDSYRYELRGLTSEQAAAVRTYKAIMKWVTVRCS